MLGNPAHHTANGNHTHQTVMNHDTKPHLTSTLVARPSPSTLRTRHDQRGRIMFTPPSKPERLGWATFYSIFAAGGAVVLISPPRTIEGPLGDILIIVWGILWVSALIPAWASLYNKYRLRSEEHTSELQSRGQLVCRLLLEKKK